MAVPDKYNYLAANAFKRDQSKSRKPKASAVLEARRKVMKQRKSVAKTLASKVGQDAMDIDDDTEDPSKDGDVNIGVGGANESDEE
jgi:hypothetical protein